MNLIELGALGEFLGAIGVVVTLIYLGIQVRRYSQQIRIQNTRGQALEAQQIAAFQASPHMLDVLEKCYAEDATTLSFKEATLMESYLTMQLASVGANYELYRIGVVDKATWQRSTVAASQLLASQWVRSFWNNQKKWLDESFVREVEKGLAIHDHSDYLELIRSGQ